VTRDELRPAVLSIRSSVMYEDVDTGERRGIGGQSASCPLTINLKERRIGTSKASYAMNETERMSATAGSPSDPSGAHGPDPRERAGIPGFFRERSTLVDENDAGMSSGGEARIESEGRSPCESSRTFS